MTCLTFRYFQDQIKKCELLWKLILKFFQQAHSFQIYQLLRPFSDKTAFFVTKQEYAYILLNRSVKFKYYHFNLIHFTNSLDWDVGMEVSVEDIALYYIGTNWSVLALSGSW